jgi:hypothetical protein
MPVDEHPRIHIPSHRFSRQIAPFAAQQRTVEGAKA